MKGLNKILLVTLFYFALNTLHAQPGEEVYGPFDSWANAKKDYGAKGDGRSDDTKAIQKAIDNLYEPLNTQWGSRPTSMVLYLPAGIYCISSTLKLEGKIGVSIIGEDPSSTIIKWIGKGNDTMFWANGSAYYKISKLTWNGNEKPSMEAIGVHWKNRWNKNGRQSFAALNIEISDNNFIGKLMYGTSGGTGPEGTNANDSEIAIRRCNFESCSKAGINITGYNALDYWIWDCSFKNCNIGVNNSYGNFHAYRCDFKGSVVSDFLHTNGYYTSIRQCRSEDSRAFSLDEGYSTNPFKRVFEGNIVLRPKSFPIQYYHWGKLSFIDNYFDKSVDPNITSTVKYGSWGKASFEVLSVDNVFMSKNPVEFTGSPYGYIDLKSTAYREKSISQMAVMRSLKKIQSVPRPSIMDVPVNASGDQIQKLIDKLTSGKSKGNILHFPVGRYALDKPLIIPANAEIKIVGDGLIYASKIVASRTFPKGQPLILIQGKPTITIAEIQLGEFDQGKQQIDALRFQDVDQPGSVSYIDQLYSFAGVSVHMKDLDYLYVQKENSFFSSGTRITGGKQVAAGKGTSYMASFGGQFVDLEVNQNGQFIAKDCWWEGPERVPLKLKGSGNITIDGFMLAPANVDAKPTIDIGKFKGNISIMNGYVQGGLSIDPKNPDLNLFLWNLHFYHQLEPWKALPADAKFNAFMRGTTMQCFDEKNPACKDMQSWEVSNVNVKDPIGFIRKMCEQDQRATPRKPAVAANASSIFISRVSIGYSLTGISYAGR